MEFPEVVSRASEIRQVLAGAVVEKVYPPSKPHKFCWWNGDPASYPEKLEGRRLVSASDTGFRFLPDMAFVAVQQIALVLIGAFRDQQITGCKVQITVR